MTPAQRQLPGVVAVHHWEVYDMPHRTGAGRKRTTARYLTGGRTHDHRLGHSDPTDLIARLGKRVEVIGDCWALDGNLDQYVSVSTPYGRMNAHRFVYLEVNGDVLDPDVHVHHECVHPGCINPAHLTPLSAGDHAKLHASLRVP